MIYSTFIVNQDGILEASRMASKVLTSPEAIIELFGEQLNHIRGEVEVGIGEFKVTLVRADDLFYLIVHDEDPKARELIQELLTLKPRDANKLYSIILKYITPRRTDVEKLLIEVAKHIEPKELEAKPVEEADTEYIDSITGFMDEYTEANYLEARKHDVSSSKHPYIKALRTFASRLARHSPPYEPVPKKEDIFRLAAQTPPRVRRYFQDLRDAMSDLGSYRPFVERFFNNRPEINEFFFSHKSLYTTLLLPIADNMPVLSRVYRLVPEAWRDAFKSRIYTAFLFSSSNEELLGKIIGESSSKVSEYKPFSYAYFLPLAIISSISISIGKYEVYANALSSFLASYGEKPMYEMFSNSALTMALPVLYEVNKSLVEKRYKEIAELLNKRFLTERVTPITYAYTMSALNTTALALSDDSLLGFLADPVMINAARLLYSYSYRGSRSAMMAFYKVINSLALSVLAKDHKNKVARDILMKSFLMIDRKDYYYNLVTSAAENSVSEDVADLLKGSFEL